MDLFFLITCIFYFFYKEMLLLFSQTAMHLTFLKETFFLFFALFFPRLWIPVSKRLNHQSPPLPLRWRREIETVTHWSPSPRCTSNSKWRSFGRDQCAKMVSIRQKVSAAGELQKKWLWLLLKITSGATKAGGWWGHNILCVTMIVLLIAKSNDEFRCI